MKTAREIIETYDGPPVRIMEVCGTHTHEIFRLGIRKLLPEQVELDEIRAKLAKGEAAQLVSKLGENIATTLKCGYAPIEDEGDVAAACDRARTACESIRDDAQLRFVRYSTEMDREDMLARYVRQSLDDALDKLINGTGRVGL